MKIIKFNTKVLAGIPAIVIVCGFFVLTFVTPVWKNVIPSLEMFLNGSLN